MTKAQCTALVVVSASLLALSGACGASPTPNPADVDGGGGAGGGAGGGGGVSVPDGGLAARAACPLLNARRCEYLQRCGLIAATDTALRECVAFYTATWCGPTKWISRIDPSINTLRYDALRAQACAESYETRSCAEWQSEPEPCVRFLSPNAVMRQACYDGYKECVDGVCRGVACGDRKCRPRGQVGEDCRVSEDCVAGLFCRPSMSPGVGVCAELGKVGSPCDDDLGCGVGMMCTPSGCAPLPATDAPCLLGRCDEASYCVETGDGGTCVARRMLEAACSDDVQCLPGSVCDTMTGRCVAKLVKQVGGACAAKQTCAPGTSCIGLTAGAVGACLAPALPGEACTRSEECQDHLACNALDGGLQCGPRRAPGQACALTRDCGAFSLCVSGLCTAIPPVGGRCDAAKQCQWGACVASGDAGLFCVEPGGPGFSCRAAGDCASGRCEMGQCLAACLP